MKNIVYCGGVPIGGDYISVQSMLNVFPYDVDASLLQIDALSKAKCDIVRVAVPDDRAASVLNDIVRNSPLPIVADIHFSASLAVKAIEAGVAKIRLNPGNVKGDLKKVVDMAKERKLPIRIGINHGSIEEEFKKLPAVDALVASALKHVDLLEKLSFSDMVISVKSSSVSDTVDAYEKLSKLGYPLHIGVTEAGTLKNGIIKNSMAIGALLLRGIGDTIRVSLSCDPVEEVICARKMLNFLGLRKDMIEVISCPTCGRTKIDVASIAEKVEKEFFNLSKPLKIAVMGCVVNGIGESEGADVGIAGGREKSTVFMDGKAVETVPNGKILDTLRKYVLLKAEDNLNE